MYGCIHSYLFVKCKLIGYTCRYVSLYTLIQFLTWSYLSASPEQGGGLSRMQSIRKSFRQSLKRFGDVRRSMRGLQSTQRSFRPTGLQRSGSTRPSMRNRTQGGLGSISVGTSQDASAEAMPLPPRKDIIKTISFTAPVQIAGILEAWEYMHIYVLNKWYQLECY